jgi:hypothetical protein
VVILSSKPLPVIQFGLRLLLARLSIWLLLVAAGVVVVMVEVVEQEGLGLELGLVSLRGLITP